MHLHLSRLDAHHCPSHCLEQVHIIERMLAGDMSELLCILKELCVFRYIIVLLLHLFAFRPNSTDIIVLVGL